MTFLKQLMSDAAPKAFAVSKATKNITNKVVNSKTVQASKAIGYKGLVNTVGVAMVLGQPLAVKAQGLVTKAWTKVEQLAAEQTSTEQQKA